MCRSMGEHVYDYLVIYKLYGWMGVCACMRVWLGESVCSYLCFYKS